MNICILFCTLAAAQIPYQTTFGKKKEKKDYETPKLFKCDASGRPLKFLIVEDGVVPTTHSDASGGPAGSPLKFGEEFRVLDIDQDTKAYFLCKIVDNAPVPLGWVRDNDLLILTDGQAKCLRSNTTLIQRKALLIYKGDEKDLKGSEGLSKLTAMLGTSANATKGQSVNFYNILYVFKEKLNEKGEASQILLGFEPEIAPEKLSNIQDSLIGWFDAKYAYRCETREALEYDVASTRPNALPPGRRTKPTPIFETSDDAEQAANTKSIDGLILLPVKEVMGEDGVSLEFAKNQNRYPIINFDKRRQKHPVQGNLFEIGVIEKGIFYKGFVWERDPEGRRQVRIKILMSDRELAKTEEVVQTFIQAIYRADKNKDLAQRVADAMVRLVSGDKKLVEKVVVNGNEEKGIAEAITKKHGIHLESYLFSKSLNQVGKMTFNETLLELNKIQYKLLLLQDILNKQKHEFIEENDGDAKQGLVPNKVSKWRVKTDSQPAAFDRFFKIQATDTKTTSYGWIDLEDELP